MSGIWLPAGLALSSAAGFVLGTLPFRALSSHADHGGHDLAREAEFSVLDYLYPITVAFFIGYLAMTLIPHAVFEGGRIPFLAFAAGAGVMAILQRKVFRHDPCCETGHAHDPIGWTFFLALSVCAVNDGILIGLLNPPPLSGLNLGMVAHKVTSSFALALALGHWNYRGGLLIVLGLANALISPVFFFAGQTLRAHGALPLEGLLAFSAGVLVYTVLTGMLPHSRKMLGRKPAAWIGFLAALAVSLWLGYLHRGFH